MAIETQFQPCCELTTSLQILKEFIFSYMSSDEIDILMEAPKMDESFYLYKPILYVETMPGSDVNCGLGRRLPNGDRGKFHYVSLMLYWIISQDVGGMDRVRQLSDTLRYAFLTRGFELEQAGLQKATCSSLREIPQATSSPFYGGRNLVTFRTLLSY